MIRETYKTSLGHCNKSTQKISANAHETCESL